MLIRGDSQLLTALSDSPNGILDRRDDFYNDPSKKDHKEVIQDHQWEYLVCI